MPRDQTYRTINGVTRLVNRVLEVASCHVSEQDAERLNNEFLLPHHIDLLDVGWLLRLDTHDDGTPHASSGFLDDFKSAGFSEAVLDLLVLADRPECLFVRIHPDGQVYSDFPTFPW